jgi:hypothetical protein
MSLLPVLSRPIGLRAASGAEYASRVEGVGEGWLTVASPRAITLGTMPDVGAEFDTIWAANNGICGLPCRLTDIRRQGVVPLWDLDVVGVGWREQRRAYVRASVWGSVRMTWQVDDERGGEAAGAVIDLSEAALRFRCRDTTLNEAELIGGPVQVALTTRDQDFELAASVVRMARAPGAAGTGELAAWDVVVLFSDPGKDAAALRRIVFQAQLRERNG